MPLWGKTDATGSKPKYLSTADKANAYFVSREEALLETNKAKGITGAGWWLIKEYKDSGGQSRYKAECLIAMSVANATSGDAADDAVVADVNVTITISAQPANQNTASGAACPNAQLLNGTARLDCVDVATAVRGKRHAAA